MNQTDETIESLDHLIDADPTNASAYYRRGRLHWKSGRHAAAITDFNTSAELDPKGPGATAATHAMSIMSFFNPDQFNP